MAKGYSESHKAKIGYEGDNLGLQLASLAIQAKIPMSYIAWALGVTRMTVYYWFAGRKITPSKVSKVEALVRILKLDLSNGDLPADTAQERRNFIEELSGEKLPENLRKPVGN